MARSIHDESHWDFDRARERDIDREPRSRYQRRAPVQLSMHGTVRMMFSAPAGARTREADLDRCYVCGAPAVGTKAIAPGQLERACAQHVDGAS